MKSLHITKMIFVAVFFITGPLGLINSGHASIPKVERNVQKKSLIESLQRKRNKQTTKGLASPKSAKNKPNLKKKRTKKRSTKRSKERSRTLSKARSSSPKNRVKAIKPLSFQTKRATINPPYRQRPRPAFLPVDSVPAFDIPVTYNKKVQKWIKYYQTRGKRWLDSRIERSHRFLPAMQYSLKRMKLPKDLAYIAMIESGFSAQAVSTASAVGHWQFIKSTANRYGLKTKWWIDERKDPSKSTEAAAQYLADLYKMFGSWYLAASAYNMGENRLKRLIKKHKTKNYWILSTKRGFPNETEEYIPKLMAVMLIAKAPKLYGFHKISPKKPHQFETIYVPGGFDLINLAQFLRTKRHKLANLNPELLNGFIPKFIKSHKIRVPKGTLAQVQKYIRKFH